MTEDLLQKKFINTDLYSSQLRAKCVEVESSRLLITSFINSEQENDLSVPPNCSGFGRIRHFYRNNDNWINNPLPIDPACKALKLTNTDKIRAQVFQNAACNWRCWYCYVPFDLLSANPSRSKMLSAETLISFYLEETEPPLIIDLTGGQPDLAPEWVPWMMKELKKRKLDNKVYLWSDDNLSNDYFWKYLSREDIDLIKTYRNYGRVCCFKGFDDASFSFNTLAAPDLFNRQFDLFAKMLNLGIDLYAYATFTTPTVENIKDKVVRFIDRLQDLSENLPLRTVPLKVEVFSPVSKRLDSEKEISLSNQWKALEEWQKELSKRFSKELRSLPITEITLY